MSSRTLKIVIAVSVGLNLFLLGVLAAGAVMGLRLAREPAGPPRRPAAVMEILSTLPEADQERVREAFHGALLRARPQFVEARRAHRRAVEAAQAEPYDRAAVLTELATAHRHEMAAREGIEQDMTQVLGELSPEGRRVIAPVLLRDPRRNHRPHMMRRHGSDDQAASS
ncbi:periplasmic heavy metal sensor [Brevundimonas sp. 2R-24]|uniref:Periplasmic heavy metal sensor n=1 Tax=Peiella sedimenti TaxID=3061083 RepID=A0ABT8SLJ7_9CAUL|nr:periplasmic heavy metal sensor [Caulobacteraceae bacterium XZ-24]